MLLNSEVVSVDKDGVVICDMRTGERKKVQGDTVIIAAGMLDQRDEAESYNDVGAGYFAMVGDCIKPKKIRDAVSSAFWAAMES